ncbi:MAG: hypothetical protein NTW08_02540 [Gammaproteobacteria bacterium]|nr:hypothetical protein [Gammaproteobacteria bacterium]
MKKNMFIFLSLLWATSSMASPQLGHMLHLSKSKKVTHELKQSIQSDDDGYTDFSGEWVGKCDDDEGEPNRLVIESSAVDFSIDGEYSIIDALHKSEFQMADGYAAGTWSATWHYRWNDEGNELLATFIEYMREGNISRDPLHTIVGNCNISIQNKQLIQQYTYTMFENGSLLGTKSTRCVYDKEG